MAEKVIESPAFNTLKRFALQRFSSLAAIVPKIGYYVNMKHLRDEGSLQDAFLFSFDSKVYPTILAGRTDILIDFDVYLNSELGFRLLTESELYLIQDNPYAPIPE